MKPILMDDEDAIRAEVAREQAHERAATIALEFCNVLRAWLTPVEMSKVIVRNRAWALEGDKSACATHDFCDANMAMDEAFKRVLGRGCLLIEDCVSDDEKQADTNLWNEAWGIAKAANFVPFDCLSHNQARTKARAK